MTAVKWEAHLMRIAALACLACIGATHYRLADPAMHGVFQMRMRMEV